MMESIEHRELDGVFPPECVCGDAFPCRRLLFERIEALEERDRLANVKCQSCGNAMAHCAAVAHAQAETINRQNEALRLQRQAQEPLVEALRKTVTFLDLPEWMRPSAWTELLDVVRAALKSAEQSSSVETVNGTK